ncbi:MAG: electron transfer flavoprotein subunit alpha/FixB family protein [Candidatus Poseidoniaceae archaeon]|mgnify:FL=1|uniref:Electron transfer flavoprotein, alpha subunit n=1 Tax=uncultured Poseidoniia archaeon TaxID=1697135 RepID=A0A1B1TBI0_9ARCH|nr:Electron transfer flavoprotein, alpha subunit [uncultured Candidatus Thalassoarchaea sp.]|tara:strand:+ start:9595 stop:10524 length:930 start_codon:yes stop_codon:yes gene_type:complete
MTNTIVIAELNKGSIHSTTKELVSAAQMLGNSCTVIVPCTDSSVADSISSTSGVAKVIVAKSEIFANYDASGWASAIDSVTPEGTIITSASPQSKDLAARLAARRKLSVVQDVVSIQDGQLTSPVYSGKAMQTVSVSGNTVVSIRQNVFDASPDGGSAEVSVIDASGNVATAVKELISRASERLDVSEANIIISGGRGMGSPDNFSHLEQIADTLGAAVGASRAAVDTWDDIPHSMQVGQTGKTVNPNLYIAVGISGAIQHLAGMRSSKYIVAINKDADAPIFQHADYGIVATWEEALPVLQSSLSAMM